LVILGIDAHKRTHTVVAVDSNGHQLATRTLGTATADHLALLRWADQFREDRQWAVEDCRHLSRRLERDLLVAGEHIARVPPKLMAHVRDSARTYGKSDPIDALAVARAGAAGARPCPPPGSTAPSARSGGWAITARPRSGSTPD
jgi:transposase